MELSRRHRPVYLFILDVSNEISFMLNSEKIGLEKCNLSLLAVVAKDHGGGAMALPTCRPNNGLDLQCHKFNYSKCVLGLRGKSSQSSVYKFGGRQASQPANSRGKDEGFFSVKLGLKRAFLFAEHYGRGRQEG